MGIFTPKVRIQRKRKPFLQVKTKQNIAFAELCHALLSISARRAGEAGRNDYQRVRTERMIADTSLKYARLSYVEAQTERTHLLNQQTRVALALIDGQVPGASGSLQHNCPRCNGKVNIPPSNKTMISVACPHCKQEWEIYPQGAEVLA